MRTRKSRCRLLALVLLLIGLTPLQTTAQSVSRLSPSEVRTSEFRVELTPVDGGAELLTIWANLVDGPQESESRQVPLVTVLRDTLGDQQKENDILRQVWVHTYVKPTLLQKAAASIPFLYSRFSNKSHLSSADTPAPVVRSLQGGTKGLEPHVQVTASSLRNKATPAAALHKHLST